MVSLWKRRIGPIALVCSLTGMTSWAVAADPPKVEVPKAEAAKPLPPKAQPPVALPGAVKPLTAPAAKPPAAPGRPTGPVPAAAAKPVKPPPPKDPKQIQEVRAKLLQRMRALRAQELSDVLKPDMAAVGKVVELAASFEDRLLATRQELRKKRSEVELLLKSPKPDDAKIGRAADDLLARRRSIEEIENERTLALRKVLNPSQFAKVVVAWPRINRKIQETLYRAILKSKVDGAGVAVGADE